MTVTIPIRTVSEANQREHWSKKHKRNKHQQVMAMTTLWNLRVTPPASPWAVSFTRVAPRRLDADNLAGSFKHVQDAVAKWLGIDDGSDQVQWTYDQRRGRPKEYAIEVQIVTRAGGDR